MKFEELFDQMEQIKKALIQASKDYDCDDVELVFKTDEGKMIHINCIEGGYAPDAKSNVLVFSSGKKELEKVFSSGKKELEKILRALMGTPTVDAEDIDVGLKAEELIKDDNP